MNRKQFLKLSGAAGAALIVGAALYNKSISSMKNKQNYHSAFGLARSLPQELQYTPSIEGKVPKEIFGTLYRNGPGLFERSGHRKNNILDGDGMLQAFHFQNGKVEYLNRFVRTQKWLEEEEKDHYIYNTWTTRRPGGILKNAFLQGKLKGQAGVTVRIIDGKLYAFDESSLPYEVDPLTLETLRGEVDFGVQFEDINTLFAAHSKVDGKTGEWIQFGLENGIKANIQLSIFNQRGKLKRKKRFELSLGTYMHDFFVSENHIVFNLQPIEMNPFSFILGMESYVESLKWKPQKGSTLMIIHKSLTQEPIFIKTEAVFMWHSVNAYEKGNEILCYFCGYDEPDHFLGQHAQTFEIMKPHATVSSSNTAKSPGSVRLFRIQLNSKKVTTELLGDDNKRSFEFPVINDAFACNNTTYTYLASGKLNGAFHHELNRLNLNSGKLERYDFGSHQYCGEPVFVPKRDHLYSGNGTSDPGWLMSLVFDESLDRSFLAVLAADKISDGPIAKIHLNHHSPMSFHGHWNNL